MPKALDRVLLLGGLLVWIAAAILVLSANQPLQHDEAAFAIGARRILSGAPAVWLYRSVGTEVLAIPGTLLGGSEIALRTVYALVSLTVPFGAYALSRAAFPERNAGGLAVAILACSHQMTLQSAQVMSDLPATGMLLLGMAVLVRELTRESGPRLIIAAAAPLLVGAFYLRYGSVPAIVSIGVAVSVCYARALLRRPTLALAGAATLLLVPHIVYSLHITGHALGVMHESAGSTLYLGPGRGLITYLTSNPFGYYGWIVFPALLVGLATCWRSREGRCIALAALGTLILLGIRSHAQPRYAFAWVAMLAVLGASGAASFLDERRAKLLAVVVGVAALANLAYVGVTARHQRDTRSALLAVARDIARDAAGRPCTLIAGRVPVLAFYSRCLASDWPDADPAARSYLVPPSPDDANIGAPDVPDHRVTRMATHPGVFIID